jgi:hypothetical protein
MTDDTTEATILNAHAELRAALREQEATQCASRAASAAAHKAIERVEKARDEIDCLARGRVTQLGGAKSKVRGTLTGIHPDGATAYRLDGSEIRIGDALAEDEEILVKVVSDGVYAPPTGYTVAML